MYTQIGYREHCHTHWGRYFFFFYSLYSSLRSPCVSTDMGLGMERGLSGWMMMGLSLFLSFSINGDMTLLVFNRTIFLLLETITSYGSLLLLVDFV